MAATPISAARAWAQDAFAGDEAKVEEFLTKLFNNVPVFETGGRGATTAFTERQQGDVLITFEAEVLADQEGPRRRQV